MIQYNISFLGAGNVGEALCREMYSSGHNIEIIVSESGRNGPSLADSCNAMWSNDYIFPQSTDIIIVSVPDHELKNVLDNISCRKDSLVAHTAGSIGLEVFPEKIIHRGVFYPLQTFSKGKKINFNGLPFLLESSDKESSLILEALVESVKGKAYFVDIEKRKVLHLAAVFVCNFTNHMLAVGKDISSISGLSFDLLFPLINETISKALDNGPENSQTGPAVRNDQNTIEKHLELLSFSPDLRRIYIEMTKSIITYNKKS